MHRTYTKYKCVHFVIIIADWLSLTLFIFPHIYIYIYNYYKEVTLTQQKVALIGLVVKHEHKKARQKVRCWVIQQYGFLLIQILVLPW